MQGIVGQTGWKASYLRWGMRVSDGKHEAVFAERIRKETYKGHHKIINNESYSSREVAILLILQGRRLVL